jgi:S-adenosylmethionine:tRNA ribosyltransferase-isomerase
VSANELVRDHPVTLPRVSFHLPPGRDATEPPEARGLERDGVRLLVVHPSGLSRTTFRALPDHLTPGDLLVVNTSATLPAAIDASRADGSEVVVHVAGEVPPGTGLVFVELRRPDGRGPIVDGRPGERLLLSGGVPLRLVRAHRRLDHGVRIWCAAPHAEVDLRAHLRLHARPITYGYVSGRWPLTAYQPVFGRVPGSAEMPSAARPFTDRLVTELVTRGVVLAPVTLHTGVSSQETGEPPLPERFEVPAATARLVTRTIATGGRVIAVGTTVARALESAVDAHGVARAAAGWTELVLGPARPARVVTGLITGWHGPAASHLALLEAVAGRDLVQRAYDAALAGDELWHEFGDSCLLLP